MVDPLPAITPRLVEPATGVRHSYPLAVEKADLGTAFGLLARTFPYALVRLGILMACTVGVVLAWVIAFWGAAWLGEHVAGWAGVVWLVLCAAGAGGIWRLALRWVLYLAKAGHVAVLTELITRGQIGNGSEGMFAYGRRIVTERFTEVNILFAVDALVKGVVGAFNRTFDGIVGLLPIPGLDGLAKIVNAIVRAATTYIDETLFSYRLARGDVNPWISAREGLVYYCQNAREVLKTALWVVVLDKVLTAVAWVVCLAPGFLISRAVPGNAGLFALGLGLLLALNLRAAFLKPLFLVMVMTKFHVCVRGQAIDETWDGRLASASDKFREIGERARGWVAGPPAPARPAIAP